MNQDNSANKVYNIKTNGLTTLPGRWILERIIINTKGASSNTIKIYDDVVNEETPANLRGTIDSTITVGALEYGIPMFNGINIRTATGTAPDLTVVYRPMA